MFVLPFPAASPTGRLSAAGARTDSYYEYLLKQWILTGKTDDRLRQRFVQAVQAIRARLLRHTGGAPAAASGDPARRGEGGAAADTDTDRSEDGDGQEGGRERHGLLYVGEDLGGTAVAKMDHLVCFLPGALALADLHGVATARPGTADAPDLEVARQLAHTCYQLYRRTPTGLAPEIAHFTDRAGAPRRRPAARRRWCCATN
jgi:mannosyl-oligosaccharide alpha-1,2-mannosidase